MRRNIENKHIHTNDHKSVNGSTYINLFSFGSLIPESNKLIFNILKYTINASLHYWTLLINNSRGGFSSPHFRAFCMHFANHFLISHRRCSLFFRLSKPCRNIEIALNFLFFDFLILQGFTFSINIPSATLRQ